MEYSRYRDSERYVKMENNYQYMSCRSAMDYKGGACGDSADRNHKQGRVKYYKNFEKNWQNLYKKGYRKIY